MWGICTLPDHSCRQHPPLCQPAVRIKADSTGRDNTTSSHIQCIQILPSLFPPLPMYVHHRRKDERQLQLSSPPLAHMLPSLHTVRPTSTHCACSYNCHMLQMMILGTSCCVTNCQQLHGLRSWPSIENRQQRLVVRKKEKAKNHRYISKCASHWMSDTGTSSLNPQAYSKPSLVFTINPPKAPAPCTVSSQHAALLK